MTKEQNIESRLKVSCYLIILSLLFSAGKYTYFEWTIGWSMYMAFACFFAGWWLLIWVMMDKYRT